MRRQQQTLTLIILALCVLGFQLGLYKWQPTIDGQVLQQAQSSIPLARLQPAEYSPLLTWLGLDALFAVLYTVFFTWTLRWLAAALPPGWLNTLGRTLSWVTALAVIFNLSRNVVLWVGATIGARHVSPWLQPLACLEWLPVTIFAFYAVCWGIGKLTLRRAAIGDAA
jgi:hypothetical protein